MTRVAFPKTKISVILKCMPLFGFIVLIGYILYCSSYENLREIQILSKGNATTLIIKQINNEKEHIIWNTSNHIEAPQNTQYKLDEQSVTFYIFWNFSESIRSYFRSCNESTIYGKHIDWKNRFSFRGEEYFSIDNLQKHKWYNPHLTMDDSDVIIIPLSLVLAANGYCRLNATDDDYYYFKNNKPFHVILDKLFTELYSLKLGMIGNQKVLLIAHEWWVCHIDDYMQSYSIKKFSYYSRLIVAHYENGAMIKDKPCFWQKNHKNDMKNRTIVIPYTIPFQYNDYKMYDNVQYNINQFHSKSYKLFFMGSVCSSFFASYRDRLLAIKYIHLLNQQNKRNHHFGIITDFNQHFDKTRSTCHKSNLKKYDISPNMINICKGSIESLKSLPCGLDIEMYDKVNKNNELYIYGLKHSKFNLMLHGDIPSSGKFYDSIAFNLINIIIGFNKDEIDLYLPFSDVIPYEKFVFFITVTKFRNNGLNELNKILYNTTQQQINEMISNMTYYKKYLLWNHNDSLVVDNILKEAKQTHLSLGSQHNVKHPSNVSKMMNISHSNQMSKGIVRKSTACLNDIYDEIFVISSPNRQKTLSITVYQLQNENISFTLWPCHTSANPSSVSLYKKFKQRVDYFVANNDINTEWVDRAQISFQQKVGCYWKENVFFLRQTQIDIMKYALSNNLSKILIFEDDILLSNPEYIHEFCEIETFLPHYLWLNIGVNQGDAYKYRYKKNEILLNVSHHENSNIKYMLQNNKSWGCFAFALQYEIYSILIDLFDNNTNILPLDNWMHFFENNKTITNHTYNIYPTLVIPDISTTILTSKKENKHSQLWYLGKRTIKGADKSIFNKYWNYRFSKNKKLIQTLHQFVFNQTPSFDQLIKH